MKILRLKKEMKEEICTVLEDYKQGKIQAYCPQNRERILNNFTPRYHNQKETNTNTKRIRFIVGSANSYNRIEVSEELRESMLKRIKDILVKYDIKNIIKVRFDSYYPEMVSRPQYATYNISLDIYVKETENEK